MDSTVNRSVATVLFFGGNRCAETGAPTGDIGDFKPIPVSDFTERKECRELYDPDPKCCCPEDIISRLLIEAERAGLEDYEEVAELKEANCISCYSLEGLSAFIAQARWLKNRIFGD